MKVKEIDRTANIAWSPASHHPIYIAAGTAAQQLDATFSTTASLEIYALNLTEPGLDMALKGSVVSDFRFHKVVWGCEGMKTSELSSGVLVGGGDDGNLIMYDPAKLLAGESALLHHKTKHTGPVHSLDFNKFQPNLLASGASESEIFIWDLNNPTSAMTPGAKSQPPEEVTCVAWNCQVQHIIASTFSARCVVWDLRKNEPIIKVSDSSSRLRCKVVAWHPEVATQLCLASEDDHSPVIQLWDLRFATSPLKTLQHHQRGVLSIAWCPQDPDLLLSCGKDNKILCWNPNSNLDDGEILCELPTSSQWSFDVAWCPRNPAVIANSSCDGHVSVFSLMGGQQQVQCSSKIAESFPGSDKFIQPAHAQSIHRHISVPLQKPPKWLRKPVGASFGFGGKLVSFINEPVTGTSQNDELPSRSIFISQVVTEHEILKKSEKLESALTTGNLVEFCQSKIDASQDEHERTTWNFLQATFSNAPRAKMLSLLGYDYERIVSEVTASLRSRGSSLLLENVDEINNHISELSTADNSAGNDLSAFDEIVETSKDEVEALIINTDPGETDGLISQALLTGNISSAVDICIQDSRWADALVLAQAGGAQILQKTQRLYFNSVTTNSSKLISAVVTSDWLSVVKGCNIECWKEILAAVLTYAKPENFSSLCESLGNRLESNPKLGHNAALCYISAGNLERLAQCWTRTCKNMDVNTLQCLIEQIMILRRAVEQLSGRAPSIETGVLSSLLGQYAEILATQGNLTSAATYLVDPNEKTLAILRDRIHQNLHYQPSRHPSQKVDVHRTASLPHQAHSQVSHQPLADANLGRKQSYPSSNQQQQQFPSYGAGVTQPRSFGYPSDTVQPQYQPYSPPTPASLMGSNVQPLVPSVPAPGPPPPESSAPSKSTGSHLSQRYPRHLHDPSVYNESSFSNQQQYYQPQQPFPASQPQLNNFSTPSYPQPTTNFYQPDVNVGNAAYPSMSSSSFQSNQYNAFVPASQPPPSEAIASMPPVPLPSCYSDVKPGWNDPPLLKQAAAQPSSADNAPITTPFPDDPVHEQPPGPPSGQHVSPGGYFVPSYPNEPSQFMNVASPVQAPHPEEPKQVQNIIEQPKEKSPIPPEHQVLQDIFEDLRRQCQQVATNPQARRKLDDVAKKLENLYDRLRENQLSNPITLGLHQIVQAILQSNYQSALSTHGQIVSTANFTEIGGFMPSIKVLLQTASQLNVFLQ